MANRRTSTALLGGGVRPRDGRALRLAAERGDLGGVQQLLNAGTDPNSLGAGVGSPSGGGGAWTPLHRAAARGHLEVVQVGRRPSSSPAVLFHETHDPSSGLTEVHLRFCRDRY